tara:strand:- start:1417 stop:1629 length:213 start_codon:yes stop_codon:yes gene_type:complete
MFAEFIQSWSLNLEPLSIISVIFQLASAAPEIDKFLTQGEKKVYSRTETIEIYRTNMKLISKKNINNTNK